jgi:hypothetical protein
MLDTLDTLDIGARMILGGGRLLPTLQKCNAIEVNKTAWIVEDMKARFRRIVELIQGHGSNRCACKTS